jgi:hypothetical protein
VIPNLETALTTPEDITAAASLFTLAASLFVRGAAQLPDDQQEGLRALLAQGLGVELRLRLNPAPVHAECVLERPDGGEAVLFHVAAVAPSAPAH